MHVVFIPYGIISAVEHLKIDMQAQKFQLRLHKKGKKDKYIWIQGSLRIGPLGVWEYVFPKESADLVLTTLGFQDVSYKKYNLNSRQFVLRKILKCEKIPKFKTNKKFLWIRDNVSLIPIGVRYDDEIKEENGWKHEAI